MLCKIVCIVSVHNKKWCLWSKHHGAGGRGLAVFSQRLCRLSQPAQIGALDKMKSGNVGVHIYSPRLLKNSPDDCIDNFRTGAKFAFLGVL